VSSLVSQHRLSLKTSGIAEGLDVPLGQFFPYLGAKTAMIPFLLKAIPPHTRYVEAFGGSAELLLAKPPSRQEVYNDVNGYLVNLFMQVRDNLEKVQERLKWLPNSRSLYETGARDFRNGVAPSNLQTT
jgi:site-specific DNA-adenine methylase